MIEKKEVKYAVAGNTQEGYIYFIGHGEYNYPLVHTDKHEAYTTLEELMIDLNNIEGPVYRRCLTPSDMLHYAISIDETLLNEPETEFDYDYYNVKGFKNFYVKVVK